MFVPKHIPHNPVRIVSKTTKVVSPCNVKSNTEKLKSSTRNDWKHIIKNCVTTCENNISNPVIPQTRHRSSMPSFLSINIAPEVNATDKKKIIATKEMTIMLRLGQVWHFQLLSITPGAAKSVKLGIWSPYTGFSHFRGIRPTAGLRSQSFNIFSRKSKNAYWMSRYRSVPICWSVILVVKSKLTFGHSLNGWIPIEKSQILTGHI